jgi:hypothetical protein
MRGGQFEEAERLCVSGEGSSCLVVLMCLSSLSLNEALSRATGDADTLANLAACMLQLRRPADAIARVQRCGSFLLFVRI